MNRHPFVSRRQRHRDEEARQHRYDLERIEDSRLDKLRNKALDRYHAWLNAEERSYIDFERAERAAGRRVRSQGTVQSRHPFNANDWLYPEEGRMPDEIRNPYENFPSTPRYERRKREWDEDRQRSRERREETRPRPPAYSREEPADMRPPTYEERENRRGRQYEGADGVRLDGLEDDFRDSRDRDIRRRRTG